MNNLSRRLLAVGVAGALSLGLIGVVRAENAPVDNVQTKAARKGKRGERGGRMQRMPGLAMLNLTAEQKAKLKAMHEEQKPRREAITKDATLSMADKKQKLRELRKGSHEKFLAVLTPEQREKLAAHRKEMKAKRAAKKSATS
jgi:Spy/CpxP family protein refolding chaperone